MGRVPKVGGTKDVNLAKLRKLAPTHVVLNTDENRLDTVQAVQAWPAVERPELIVTHPCAPEDVPALIDQLQGAFGALPGVAARAVALREALCPRAGVQLVDGEALSWYGARTVAGLRYARSLAEAGAREAKIRPP